MLRKKQFESEKTMKEKKIVKTLKENGNAGAFIEFSQGELDMMGLKSGDMVEWMQLDDGTVWKKVTKNEWSL
jgi:formylmethanofuran dehydrogenase subunit D